MTEQTGHGVQQGEVHVNGGRRHRGCRRIRALREVGEVKEGLM